ncbi:hypothetical protein ACFWUW_10720 [Streptomyces sp. NPDC058655]|uniref:hypothetical protein n=1 Tax=Streptomyces sp. NPDC058655 TaxID=3346577 RepID=UPI003667CA72
MAQSTGVVGALFLPSEDTAGMGAARSSATSPYRELGIRSERHVRPAVTAEMLPQLIPYTPPLARDSERCLCGTSGRTCEESMCRPCRELAVATHGQRLTRLLGTIRYYHRGVRLSWTEASGSASAFTPRVDFLMPDVHNPDGPPHLFRGFAYWEDDQLIAACAKGASDGEIQALALAMAHYALATLAIHEVDEWYSYRSAQVYPPHRTDPYIPQDEDRGPDGNGAVVLWLTYGSAAHKAAGQPNRDTPRPARHLPLEREDLAIMPGQTLHIDLEGIGVTPPGSSVPTTNTWSAPREGEDLIGASLRDVHYALVMSELAVVADNLTFAGRRAFAPTPGTTPHAFIPWDAYLTYDG